MTAPGRVIYKDGDLTVSEMTLPLPDVLREALRHLSLVRVASTEDGLNLYAVQLLINAVIRRLDERARSP